MRAWHLSQADCAGLAGVHGAAADDGESASGACLHARCARKMHDQFFRGRHAADDVCLARVAAASMLCAALPCNLLGLKRVQRSVARVQGRALQLSRPQACATLCCQGSGPRLATLATEPTSPSACAFVDIGGSTNGFTRAVLYDWTPPDLGSEFE
jgi:hypothetical protein